MTTTEIAPAAGKLLGLDVGQARIGVAVCDPLQIQARPLSIIERTTRRDDFELLAAIVLEQEANAVICGLPLRMDGAEDYQARTTRKWAKRLAYALRALVGHPVPIIFCDERLSTFAAQEYFDSASAREADDAVAAAIILQRYLDRSEASSEPDLGYILLPTKPAESLTHRDQEQHER